MWGIRWASCRTRDDRRGGHGNNSEAAASKWQRAERAQNLTKINLPPSIRDVGESLRGSSSSSTSILSGPFVDRGIEPASIMSRPQSQISIDKLNIERQPRGWRVYRCSYTDRYAFSTTAISTVIIGEGRKKEFAWVFQRYDAYTAFNLLEKDLSRSSPPLRCFNLVLDTSLIYLNWPSIEWHRTIRVFSSSFTNSVSRDFQADREIEIFVYLRTFVLDLLPFGIGWMM